MKIVLYQKFISGGTNEVCRLDVENEEIAAEAAENEQEWLQSQGFPGIVRWEYEDWFDEK